MTCPPRFKKRLLAVLLPAVATYAAAEEVTLTIPPPKATDSAVERVKRLLPPHVGCAVLVTGVNEDSERVVFKKGFGYRQMRPGDDGLISSVRVTPQTNFRVASLTKPFVAAAILRLADEGRLSLEDPVTRWLPGIPAYAGEVTIRHLLTHTSGIPSYRRILRNRPPAYLDDLAVLRTIAAAERLDFAAGSRCVYSETGYALLGLVVQQASGQSLHLRVRNEVLGPLGMRRSRIFIDGLNLIDERAYGHKPGSARSINRQSRQARERQLERLVELRERIVAQQAKTMALDTRIDKLRREFAEEDAALAAPRLGPKEIDPNAWHEEDQDAFSRVAGEGTLYSSLDDLLRLLESLRDREALLSAESLDLWLEPQTTPAPNSADGQAGGRYTCGWVVDEELGETRYSHRGATCGFLQTFQWLPESERAVVVLMNSEPPADKGSHAWDDARIERLGEQVLAAVLTPTDQVSGLERLAEPTELREPTSPKE